MKTAKALFGIFTITLALSVQAQFAYTNNGDGTCSITGYTGAGGAVAIPTNINGLTVIGIGSGDDDVAVFSASLTSVTIPSSITSIGSYAFGDCTSLTSVTIPASVTNIGEWAFNSCTSLTGITIPASVVSIEEDAFENCYNLINVTIPAGVTSIGGGAFLYCTSLTNVTIPGSVISIGGYAFDDCSITSVTIPASVTSIGSYAFANDKGLTNATIGSSVTNIGQGAFSGCTILTSLYFLGNAPIAAGTVFQSDGNATGYYLAGTSGWSNFAANTGLPVVMLNAPNPNGSLQVTISPDGVITNGAQWQVDGGIPQPSGAVVSGLSAGNHTVSFNAVSGWTTPANQTVSVSSNSTAIANGTYAVIGSGPTGSLQVTIAPAQLALSVAASEALNGGGDWQVDGGTLQKIGATVSGLAVGTHTVSFTAINGWTTPTNQTVTITSGATTTATGTYVAITQTNSTPATNMLSLPTTLNIVLVATIQLPNKTSGTNITTMNTKEVSLNSKSILKLLGTSRGAPFPNGSYLALDGGTVEVISPIGYGTGTNLSGVFTVNSGTEVVSGTTNAATGKQNASGTAYTVITFNDGNGNAFTVDGLIKENIAQTARNNGDQTETDSFSGDVTGFGTLVDSQGNTDTAVFSGTISGSGKGAVVP